MTDTGMNDLQVVEDEISPEEEESLVYEETDTEMDQPPPPVEGGEPTISILGFELQKESIFICLLLY